MSTRDELYRALEYHKNEVAYFSQQLTIARGKIYNIEQQLRLISDDHHSAATQHSFGPIPLAPGISGGLLPGNGTFTHANSTGPSSWVRNQISSSPPPYQSRHNIWIGALPATQSPPHQGYADLSTLHKLSPTTSTSNISAQLRPSRLQNPEELQRQPSEFTVDPIASSSATGNSSTPQHELFYCPEPNCPRIEKPFTRRDNLNTHLRSVHNKAIPKRQWKRENQEGGVGNLSYSQEPSSPGKITYARANTRYAYASHTAIDPQTLPPTIFNVHQQAALVAIAEANSHPPDFPTIADATTALAPITPHVRATTSSHVCNICQKQCVSDWKLKDHMKSHRNGIDEVFPCETCGRQYRRKRDLTKHLKDKHSHMPPSTQLNRTQFQASAAGRGGTHNQQEELAPNPFIDPRKVDYLWWQEGEET